MYHSRPTKTPTKASRTLLPYRMEALLDCFCMTAAAGALAVCAGIGPIRRSQASPLPWEDAVCMVSGPRHHRTEAQGSRCLFIMSASKMLVLLPLANLASIKQNSDKLA
jgi:hypothetical protein